MQVTNQNWGEILGKKVARHKRILTNPDIQCSHNYEHIIYMLYFFIMHIQLKKLVLGIKITVTLERRVRSVWEIGEKGLWNGILAIFHILSFSVVVA